MPGAWTDAGSSGTVIRTMAAATTNRRTMILAAFAGKLVYTRVWGEAAGQAITDQPLGH